MTGKITIKRQNRKSLAMRITPEGAVVFIPRWLRDDDPRLQRFIQDSLEKLDAYIPQQPPEERISLDEIRDMVAEWAPRIGVQPKRITFRNMYTRWGSCSSRENVSLNRNLRYLPHHLVEYVVCHELVHLRELNHSKAFWALMTQFMPDWKARRKELNNWRF
jgi:predicted metal-dependent hydrolase